MRFVDEWSMNFLKVIETAAIAAAKTMGPDVIPDTVN